MEVVLLQLSIVFGSSVCAYLYSKGRNAYISAFFLIISFLVLFIPAALRGDLGTDYVGYINYYYGVIDNDLYTYSRVGKEFVYVNLCLLLGHFGLPAQSHIMVIAFLTYFFIYLATPKKYLPIVILIYTSTFYFSSWHLIRQTLAISIAYYATMLLIRKKYVLAFLFIWIATGCHTIAVLYFPVFLLFMFIKLPSKSILLISALFFITANVITIEMVLGETAKYFEIVEKSMSNNQARELDIKGSGFGILGRYVLFIPILLSLSYVIKKNDSILKNILLRTDCPWISTISLFLGKPR
jgi:hypothetical protein